MSLAPWAISESWRNYGGMWNPAVEPWIIPLGDSKCHAPRVVQCPPLEQAMIDPFGKLEYNFRLLPGSVIFGALGGAETMQLTDVGLGHGLFQEPNPPAFDIPGADLGLTESLFLFSCPWPVTGDGLFTFEAWNRQATAVRVNFQLFVAEVTTCPVR